jgi:hypothetical protein
MTARKDQTIEWSSRDKIVWGKPQTYNKTKGINLIEIPYWEIRNISKILEKNCLQGNSCVDIC